MVVPWDQVILCNAFDRSVVSLPPPLHHYGDSGQDHMREAEDYEVLYTPPPPPSPLLTVPGI